MLAYLVNDQAVGIYAAAARLSEVWYLLPVAVMTGYFPQLLAAKQEGTEDYSRTPSSCAIFYSTLVLQRQFS